MLNCPRCRKINQDDARFCVSCGTAFALPTGKPPPKSNNAVIAGMVLLIVVISSCVICGLVGKSGNKQNGLSANKTTFGSNSNNSSNTGFNSQPSGTPSPETPRPLVSASPGNSKSATVISENANLRDTPATSGKVIQMVPEGASVEVIRQKGAWFYVSSSGQKGWLHGNMLRYENAATDTKNQAEAQTKAKTREETKEEAIKPDPSLPRPDYPSISRASKKTPAPEIDNAGATARCRDGSLSYSAHRRGTCSHHGGVAVWF